MVNFPFSINILGAQIKIWTKSHVKIKKNARLYF